MFDSHPITFSSRLCFAFGALFGMFAVIFSALTSHLPDSYFSAGGREMARIADNIMGWQAVALIVIAILSRIWRPSIHMDIIGGFLLIGLALFGGAVYYTAFTGQHPPLLPIAPIGGTMMIFGWFYLFLFAVFARK